MKKFLSWKLLTVLIVTVFLGLYDMPVSVKEKYLSFLPESVVKNRMHLGLDLQGGSQLDYKVVLPEMDNQQKEQLVEGVKSVIERRVNGLGVAEPNIYRANIAGEEHIVIELADNGILVQADVDQYLGGGKIMADLTEDEKKTVSLEKAKAVVGKTIQLEFKEQKTEIDPAEKEKIEERAKATLEKIKNGGDFAIVAQEEQQSSPESVEYQKPDYTFESELPSSIKDKITALEIGAVTKDLAEVKGNFVIGADGAAQEQSSLGIIKLVDVKEEVKSAKSVETSHILIAFSGAEGADATVTRTKDDAYKLAKEIKDKVDNGGDFAALAKEFSNDSSNKNDGGKLTTPVTGDGTYVYDFEQAALAFEKDGEVSDIVTTQFGYHIIKGDKVTTDVKEKKYKYEMINYSTAPDQWQGTALTGEHFVRADVQVDNMFQPYVAIQFDKEGAQIFKDLTTKNINKPIAIFVGGNMISAPTVNGVIPDGNAIITGQFTQEEASDLARDLNTGAIPAPIILTGEYTIGATLGQQALDQSLMAGAIGILLVMVFMLFYYKLPGLIANVALVVYAVILLFLLQAHLSLGLALAISIVVFGFMIWRIVNSKESGAEKFLSFVLSCFGFFFLSFLLKSGVTVTLAGFAGIVMSIGIAVDANILIFERLKEELNTGKSLNSAIDTAFKRAWSAIRDSNFSTLFTCAILFYFGSSIIRGFAFNLAAGIMVSMFTAVVITRLLLQSVASTKLGENIKLFGHNPKPVRTFDFIKHSKLYFTIAGAMVGVAVVCIGAFGLNLGIDFKGGSLMEINFEEKVTKEQVEKTLTEASSEITATTQTTTAPIATEKTTPETKVIKPATPTAINFKSTEIIPTEKGFILKTPYLTSEQHDQLLVLMKEKLPKFTESRFTTIGASIGNNLLIKALEAIAVSVIVIILYIAFAFRKLPKSVSAWRFGSVAVVGLLHDVITITGIFVLLGQFFDVEINALFITAMLTVFGYSVNDTIVILDRLRENILKGGGESLTQVANRSLNETLARSINTSLATVLTLVAILFMGSSSIFYFVLALTLGIIVGTYSSIFIAAPLLVMWDNSAKKPKA